MSRVFITGSADGLGRSAAATLLADGHEMIVHVRSDSRLAAVADLTDRGARPVVGDLADLRQTRSVARQVDELGRMDAVIHNAGVGSGPSVMPVNVVAPYLLTALMDRPRWFIYLSSGMHRGGRPRLDGVDWAGRDGRSSYSDSKLFVTALAVAVARVWPDVCSNAVDPGWVPTRMGGPGAPDDLRLGHLTQEWLATSDEAEAQTSGGYWYHQQRSAPHPAIRDERFQGELMEALAESTGSRCDSLHLGGDRFTRAERWFERRGHAAVFLGRITPLVRSFISIPAGVFRSPFPSYVALTLLGSLIWCFAFAAGGWVLGSNWESFHSGIRYVDYAAVAAVAVAAAAIIYRRRAATT